MPKQCSQTRLFLITAFLLFGCETARQQRAHTGQYARSVPEPTAHTETRLSSPEQNSQALVDETNSGEDLSQGAKSDAIDRPIKIGKPTKLKSGAKIVKTAKVKSDACSNPGPLGHPKDFTLAKARLGDVTVGAAFSCETSKPLSGKTNSRRGAEVVLKRATGSYRLVLGSDKTAKICRAKPEPDANCDAVLLDRFLGSALEQLRFEQTSANGTGAGCWSGGSRKLHFIGLHDWHEVDRAARLLAQAMQEWDVRGEVGIAIRPAACDRPL